MPEIREDAAERLEGNTRIAIGRVVTKLYTTKSKPQKSEESLGIILDNFWREFVDFRIRLDPMDLIMADS